MIQIPGELLGFGDGLHDDYRTSSVIMQALDKTIANVTVPIGRAICQPAATGSTGPDLLFRRSRHHDATSRILATRLGRKRVLLVRSPGSPGGIRRHRCLRHGNWHDISARLAWLGFSSLGILIAALQLFLDRGEQLDWFSSKEIIIEAMSRAGAFYALLKQTLMA